MANVPKPKNFEDLMGVASFQAAFLNQREQMRVDFKVRLMHYFNGGRFDIDPALISYVRLLIDEGDTNAIIIDTNENPIFIADLKGFYEDIREKYRVNLQRFYTRYKKLMAAKSSKDVKKA